MTCIRLTFAAAALAAVACSEGPVAPPDYSENIEFVRGNNQSDTVLSAPIQSLVVRVLDDAQQPVSGMVVRFESRLTDWFDPAPYVLVSSVGSSNFTTLVADTTNGAGEASVRVLLGTRAGTARLAVIVPDLGAVDSASFTVLPGTAVGVGVFPMDTAVYVGGTVTLRGRLVDSHGNERSEVVPVAEASPAVTLAGNVATAVAVGRAAITATHQQWTATSWISVVPRASAAAVRGDSVCVFEFDGTGFDCLTVVSGGPYGGIGLSWNPAGTELQYSSNAGGPQRLFAVDLAGHVRRVIPGPPGTLDEEVWAGPVANSTLFFSGSTGGSFSLWRANANGSSPTQIMANTAYGGIMWRPWPSPDGTKVAFVTPGSDYSAAIRVLTVLGNAVSPWEVSGQTPRFSPDGQSIVFVQQYGGRLRVMTASGTNVHDLNQQWYAETGASWSPDGQWVIARGATSLEIVSVATGEAIPLGGFTANLVEPAWKP